MGNMCDSFIINEDNQNAFKIWQGLVGAHYTPYVDGAGNLSWTNNGGLPNPPTVNINGRGLTITGVVANTGDLPATAAQYDTYLVGSDEEYYAYMYVNGTWVNMGAVGKGEQGDPGVSPTVEVTAITGGHQVEITDAEGTTTFDVMDGADGVGVPSGGTTGQVLAKASNTDYDAEWITLEPGIDPASSDPLMDGTAAVGTSTKYAREDHVHPLYNQFVRPNLLDNWYFIGGGSQQGGGQFPINQRGQTSYDQNASYGMDRWRANNSKITINSGSVNVKLGNGVSGRQRFTQITQLSIHSGEKYTFSALMKVNTNTSNCLQMWLSNSSLTSIQTHSLEASVSASYQLYSWTFTVASDASNVALELITNTSSTSVLADFDIKAIKLELGSTQTLAHQENGSWVLNEIPNYQQELAKCQRYFTRVYASITRPVGFGYAQNGLIRFSIPIPVPLAKTPTVSVTGTLYYANSGGGTPNITSLTQANIASDGSMAFINFSGFSDTAFSTGSLVFGGGSATYIDFSADL